MLRFLFVKVGWMQNYAGKIPGDEKPIGGGGYNEKKVGSEIYNFRLFKGHYYGFFQPPRNKINLERIDTAASNQNESLENVLIVLVAPKPGGGQVIVGWYRNATLLRVPILRPPGRSEKKDGHYCIVGRRDRSVLVPPDFRDFLVPKKGGVGQAQICYPLDDKHKPKRVAWLPAALRYVAEYDGPNLLTNPEAAAEKESAAAVEAALARAGGQGFARTPAERRAIEEHSMAVAKRYFRANGFKVKDVHKFKPFDLQCVKGKREVHVEVKGTTTTGAVVILTKNEVGHASKPKADCVLFVLHSIRLANGKAKGGKRLVHEPWRPDANKLTAITYAYRF